MLAKQNEEDQTQDVLGRICHIRRKFVGLIYIDITEHSRI